MSYRPGKGIVRDKLKAASVAEIACELGIDPTHIYLIDERGVSPTLHEALIEAGWIEPPRDTSTVAFHFHDQDLAQAFRELVDGHEGGRYEWVRMIVEESRNGHHET